MVRVRGDQRLREVRLQSAGMNATAVQNPLTSFADDVAATRRALAMQDGPTVLVAHSYGGMVVSEAGVASNVTALVYIAARAPDAGEDYPALAKRFPAPPASAGLVTSAQKTTSSPGFAGNHRSYARFSKIVAWANQFVNVAISLASRSDVHHLEPSWRRLRASSGSGRMLSNCGRSCVTSSVPKLKFSNSASAEIM